jgi:HlyD family secretion protein
VARRSRRLKWPIIGAVVVVAAGAGTAYAVAGGTAAPNYRTVSAGTGDVDETLTLTGLVDVASRSDLSFGTGGTIAKIKVAQGEQIKLGQVIATLKTDDLDATVTEAEATLAKARAQLESDANSQTSSVQNAATTTKPSTGSSGSSSSGSAGQSSAATAALLRKLKAEQQAVIAAQSAASGALSAAAASLAAQTAACANAYQTPSAAPSATATATPTSSTADQNAACAAALADVQAKQEAVKTRWLRL